MILIQPMPIQRLNRCPGVFFVDKRHIHTDRGMHTAVIAMYHHLSDLPILAKKLWFAKVFFGCIVGRDPNHIHQISLHDAVIVQMSPICDGRRGGLDTGAGGTHDDTFCCLLFLFFFLTFLFLEFYNTVEKTKGLRKSIKIWSEGDAKS